MAQTEQGPLCERCDQEALEEEAGAYRFRVSGIMKVWLVAAGVLVVGIAGLFVPENAYQSAVDAAQECLEGQPFSEREPKECVRELESASWVKYFPHTADGYERMRSVLSERGRATQLVYTSSAEPSKGGRREALSSLMAHDSPDAHPQRFWLDVPMTSFLWGVNHQFEKGPLAYTPVLQEPHSMEKSVEEMMTLATSMREPAFATAIREQFSLKQGEVYWSGCHDCHPYVRLMAYDCLRGSGEIDSSFPDKVMKAIRGRSRSVADAEEGGAEWMAEELKKRREYLRDVARSVVGMCSERDSPTPAGGVKAVGSEWWAEADDIEAVRAATDTRDALFDTTVLAYGITELGSGTSLREALAERWPMQKDVAETDVGRAIRKHASAARETMRRVTRPEALLSLTPLILPERLLEAAQRLESAQSLSQSPSESVAPGEALADALALQGALYAARLGNQSKATEGLSAIQGLSDSQKMAFEAVINSTYGNAERAASQWSKLSGAAARMQVYRSMAAAGRLEQAISRRLDPERPAPEYDSQVPRPLGVSDEELAGLEAGMSYAMFAWAEGDQRQALLQELPRRFRPEHLTDAGVGEEPRFKLMEYIQRFVNLAPHERKRLRMEPVVVGRMPVWYQLALAGVVEEGYDPAVWLDFVTGQGQLEPAVSNWQRAEVARWRQAVDDARAWQGRVFVAREFRDSPRDLLLLALSGE